MLFCEQLADKVGVKLNELFDLAEGNKIYRDVYINENGVQIDDSYVNEQRLLFGILNGNMKVLHRNGRFKHGEEFFYITTDKKVEKSYWHNDCFDYALYLSGNWFKTEKEAKDKMDSVLEQWEEVLYEK